MKLFAKIVIWILILIALLAMSLGVFFVACPEEPEPVPVKVVAPTGEEADPLGL